MRVALACVLVLRIEDARIRAQWKTAGGLKTEF
jgi:hypothetical protein